MTTDLIKELVDIIGAGKLTPIKQSQIKYNPDLRNKCELCNNYGAFYTCPPNVGTKEDCIEKAKTYPEGYIYSIDDDNNENFSQLSLNIQKKLKEKGIEALHLGNCGCILCTKCGKKDNVPCRNRQMAIASLKSYCIDGAETLKKITGETKTQIGLILIGGDGKELLPEKKGIKVEYEGFLPEFKLNSVSGKYGAAVDIGTTTIVARVVDLRTGRLFAPASDINRQRSMGLDVMSRIEAALKGGLSRLNNLVKTEVDELIDEACKNADISLSDISNIVITGNTTELYLYTNRSPETLAAAPFTPDCLFGYTEGKTTYPPCFGAFVGGDIYTAVLASGMLEKDETAILADLGTNGEIILYNNGRLVCCATACGPAFESSTVLYGNEIIDLISELLDNEIINPGGHMEKAIEKDGKVILTPEDVRGVQLAKAAICAGIISLLEMCKIDAKDIKTLYLAGGFGKHLNVKSAVRIGLFPKEFENKVKVIGNGALSGAIRMLLDKDYPGYDIIKTSECINLANTNVFEENYIDQMSFEENE